MIIISIKEGGTPMCTPTSSSMMGSGMPLPKLVSTSRALRESGLERARGSSDRGRGETTPLSLSHLKS